ncbi:MAG: sigma-70 family RNA polymerase sigma factor [Candidatus Latescibacterota bacterium]|nr:sigma-70 family RNA polymerase sigma factor [Candidatus Latescibacterota bacterium]
MLNWLRTWAQDAFLAAYKDLGRLQAPHAFPGWFKLIVLRKAYRLQRQRVVAPNLPVDDLHLATASPAQDDQLEQLESRRLVYRAIADLPEHGRLSTTLFYLTGYPQNQIAEMLDVPAATIRKRRQRARDRFKERMLGMVEETFAPLADDDSFATQTRGATADSPSILMRSPTTNGSMIALRRS